MAEDEVDFSKMSIEDRATHKAWKARLSACEDMVKIFGKIDDEKSPEWNKYTNLIRKLPVDSNAAVLEKGLEATLIYVENSASAGRLVAEIMNGVISKCLTGSRAKTRELAVDITMMCVEIEKYEPVMEELMKGMEQKNPKLVAACITLLTQILREFGPKVLNLKNLVKKIVPLSEDRDKVVREVNKKLTCELFRWLGAGLRPQLANVKPLVMQELETEFEKLSREPKAVQLRFLRSQQAKKEKSAEAEEETEEVVVEDNADAEIDPFDLIEPVDILSKLPKDFYETCESKKWQERKDVLGVLEGLVANPKLEPGDYADLVRVLKRMISKDTNVTVVASAGKCLTGLASGLKKRFSPYAPSCIGTILEKFKEKKPAVLTTMREASDVCFAATSLELIQEDAVAALGNKNPAIKAETALLMARCFSKTSLKILNDKKFMKPFFTALLANLNESDPVVRDAAAEALGVCLKAIGDKPMAPFLGDLDSIKMAKVQEFADKAVLTMPKPKVVKAAPKPAPAASPVMEKAKANLAAKPPRGKAVPGSAASTATYRVDKSAANKPVVVELESPEPAPKVVKPGAKGPFKPKTSPTGKKAGDEPTGLNLPSNNMKAQRNLDEMKMKMIRWQFTVPRAEYVELLKDLTSAAGFSKHLSNLLFHADFKNHLRALDILTGEFLIDPLPTIQNYDLILKWLSLRFYDTNPSVLIKALEYSTHTLRVLGEQNFQMSDLECSSYVPHLLTKIGDSKDVVRTHVHTILRQMHVVTQASKIFTYVMEGLKSKNARARSECLDELTHMISTFTTTICQPSPTVALNLIARQISDRDNAVRNSALNCVVEVYFLTGDKIYKMIGQLNDKDMSLLEERIKRAAKQRENAAPPPAAAPAPAVSARLPTPVAQLASAASVNSGVPSASSQASSAASVGATILYANGSTSSANSDLTWQASAGFAVPAGFAPPAPAAKPPSGLAINAHISNTRSEPHANDNFCTDEGPMEGDFVQQGYDAPRRPEPARTVRKWTCPSDYRVDFGAIDNMFGAKDKEPMPPLELHDTDIEYLKYELPVALPRRTAERKPVEPGTKDLYVPPKASQSIDMTVSQVGTSDLRKVLEAATQVEALLADPAVANVMVTRVDHLLFSVTSQLHRLIPLLQNYKYNNLGDINKVYRSLVHLLQTFYKGSFLPLHVSKDILRDLIYHLLLLIVEPNINVLVDPTTLVRNINILVVRVIERSDPNATITALIRLLNETLRMTSQPRLLDLTMKCQWKLLKQLNVWMKDKTVVFDIRSFIQEFNAFFRSHPLGSFEGNETPLKTIKTIFHSLVMSLGPEAFVVAMAGLPELKDTEAEKYLNKLIAREMARKGSGDISSAHEQDTDNGPINNNSNNNIQEFLKSLPDPQNSRAGQDKASVYEKRLEMIRQRGGLNKPSLSDECLKQDSLDSMF